MLRKSIAPRICLMTLIIYLSLLSFLSLPLLAGDVGVSGQPDHITLTWTGDTRTTQTITWRTDVDTTIGEVQYIAENESKLIVHHAKIVTSKVEELSTNLGTMNIHSVTLTGLKPGVRYNYQIGDGTHFGDLHSFITAPAVSKPFGFLLFGDSQSINYNTWGATLHQAYQAHPDAAFLINVGDLVDVGQDYSQWNPWFDAGSDVIDAIPIMPVTGNHETYTPERQFSMPTFFTAQLKVPANGPEGLTGQAYSFDYEDVHFSILDSQEAEESRFLPDMLERQKEWLQRDLEATQKKWKIVLLHRPLYTNRVSGGNESHIKMTFMPIFDQYHVDVVFNGHEHVYARSYPLYGDRIVQSTAQGTVYVTTGRSGSKTYQDMYSTDLNAFFYNPLDEPNYLSVEVGADSLTVNAFKESGVLIDTWKIDKFSSWK